MSVVQKVLETFCLEKLMEDVASLHLLHGLLEAASAAASPCESCVQGHWCKVAKGEKNLLEFLCRCQRSTGKKRSQKPCEFSIKK